MAHMPSLLLCTDRALLSWITFLSPLISICIPPGPLPGHPGGAPRRPHLAGPRGPGSGPAAPSARRPGPHPRDDGVRRPRGPAPIGPPRARSSLAPHRLAPGRQTRRRAVSTGHPPVLPRPRGLGARRPQGRAGGGKRRRRGLTARRGPLLDCEARGSGRWRRIHRPLPRRSRRSRGAAAVKPQPERRRAAPGHQEQAPLPTGG